MDALKVFNAALEVAGVSKEKKLLSEEDINATRSVLKAVDTLLESYLNNTYGVYQHEVTYRKETL